MLKLKTDENNLLIVPRIGQIIDGKIIKKEKSALFLDLGSFGTGIIYGKEFQAAKNTFKSSKIGDNISAKIIDLENEDGYVELSIGQADVELSWEKLKKIKENKETIKVKISRVNKGGLMGEVFGIPAFLPLSHLSSENYPKIEKTENNDRSKTLKDLQRFINQEMDVRILDIDSKKQKLILSEKTKENDKIKELLKNYKADDIVDGEITGITNFGAYFNFPADKKEIKGLIHISELDWKPVENPNEIVKIGQKVKAKIIDISEEKVFLSLKALKKPPRENTQENNEKK